MAGLKTLEVARVTLEGFFRRHSDVFFWTFTEPGRKADEPFWTKHEAEDHFKPFRDSLRRKGIAHVVVWERQKRGAWHPHVLVNRYLDVNLVRPFMVDRGWGKIMKVIRCSRVSVTSYDGQGGVKTSQTMPGARGIVSYLTKYLTKSLHFTEGCANKKVFGVDRGSRRGTVNFKWHPSVRAGAWLYASGLALFLALNGELPRWKDTSYVIRLGVEDTGYAAVNPWWEFDFPAS